MSGAVQRFSRRLGYPVGPVEVQEEGEICWNSVDWPAYIKCPFAVDAQQLAVLVQRAWCLRKPEVLITVVSDFRPLDQWTLEEAHLEQLTVGLSKTASSARMWMVTNGVDVGSSRLLAAAVNRVKLWQRAIESGQQPNRWASDPGDKSTAIEATCIGVVREDRLTSDPLMQRYLKNVQALGDRHIRLTAAAADRRKSD